MCFKTRGFEGVQVFYRSGEAQALVAAGAGLYAGEEDDRMVEEEEEEVGEAKEEEEAEVDVV